MAKSKKKKSLNKKGFLKMGLCFLLLAGAGVGGYYGIKEMVEASAEAKFQINQYIKDEGALFIGLEKEVGDLPLRVDLEFRDYGKGESILVCSLDEYSRNTPYFAYKLDSYEKRGYEIEIIDDAFYAVSQYSVLSSISARTDSELMKELDGQPKNLVFVDLSNWVAQTIGENNLAYWLKSDVNFNDHYLYATVTSYLDTLNVTSAPFSIYDCGIFYLPSVAKSGDVIPSSSVSHKLVYRFRTWDNVM